MAVRADEADEALLDEVPARRLGIVAVDAEKARRVHLQEPAALGELDRTAGIVDHGLRPLRMCDHRGEAGRLDLLGDPDGERQGPGEGKLHQHRRKVAQAVAGQIVLEERRHGRQLEAEPEVQAALAGQDGRHLRMGRPDPLLPLAGEAEVRPDVRRREEDARAVRGRRAAEIEAVLERRRAVVTRGDDVRVDVPEHALRLARGPGRMGSGRYSARR